MAIGLYKILSDYLQSNAQHTAGKSFIKWKYNSRNKCEKFINQVADHPLFGIVCPYSVIFAVESHRTKL